MTGLIEAHGGTLINRVVEGKKRDELQKKSGELKKVTLNEREISDLIMVAVGAFSPIEGFMKSDDYNGVMDTMTLADGNPWTLPVTLSTKEKTAKGLKEGEDVSLVDGSGKVLAILHLEEIYNHDKEKEALQVYGTAEDAHPGVAKVYEMGEKLLGGKISLLARPEQKNFKEHRLDPAETRQLFKDKGKRASAP